MHALPTPWWDSGVMFALCAIAVLYVVHRTSSIVRIIVRPHLCHSFYIIGREAGQWCYHAFTLSSRGSEKFRSRSRWCTTARSMDRWWISGHKLASQRMFYSIPPMHQTSNRICSRGVSSPCYEPHRWTYTRTKSKSTAIPRIYAWSEVRSYQSDGSKTLYPQIRQRLSIK